MDGGPEGWMERREGGRAKDLVVANFRDISFLLLLLLLLSFLPSFLQGFLPPSLPPSLLVPLSSVFSLSVSFGCEVSERRRRLQNDDDDDAPPTS